MFIGLSDYNHIPVSVNVEQITHYKSNGDDCSTVYMTSDRSFDVIETPEEIGVLIGMLIQPKYVTVEPLPSSGYAPNTKIAFPIGRISQVVKHDTRGNAILHFTDGHEPLAITERFDELLERMS